jgi:CRISPR-associated protein Cas2
MGADVMALLVTYDVDTTTPDGARRLRKVAKICEGIGLRVQKSVFEVMCTDVQFVELEYTLSKVIDPTRDSIRVYRIPMNTFARASHHGTASAAPHQGDHLV